MDNCLQPDQSANTKQKLIELSSAYVLSRAIHVAATMNIADHLADGSCHIDILASKIGANSDALYRLLRLLASYEIFHEDENKKFWLTPLAQPLLANHPDSIKAWLVNHEGDQQRWQAHGAIEHSIRTGKPAFDHLFGQGYFDYIAQDTSKAQAFDEGMRNVSAEEDAQIAAAYDFSWAKNILDIGGGKGGLVAEILKRNQHAHATLYDLPHVMPSAQTYLDQHELAARVDCKSGSFFEAVPGGADVYLLKRILHDWDNKDCVSILRNCADAMSKDARLLIIEAVVAQGNARDFIKDVDMEMMVLFGGRERTMAEWQILLSAAGLRLVNVQATKTMLSIIEVMKY